MYVSIKIVVCITVAFPVKKLGKRICQICLQSNFTSIGTALFRPLLWFNPHEFYLHFKKNTTPKMLNISKTKYRNHGKLELFYVHNKPDSSDSPPLRWLQRLQIVFTISPRSHDSSPEATHRHRTTKTKLRNIVTTLF